MRSFTNKNEPLKETLRIEFFSDAVFAIAITLLILEIKVPDYEELRAGLPNALLEKWPSYLAFVIGFFTVLVCWINHHYIFNRIQTASHSLIIFNGLTLFVVCFLPFPTAILAQSFKGGDLQAADEFYGISYILMTICYWRLSTFVYDRKNETYSHEEKKYKKAINTMYSMSIVHTAIALIITYYSVIASLFLYALLFIMFLFPVWYSNLILKWQNRKIGKRSIKLKK